MPDLLSFTAIGIFCKRANVYVDPLHPVDKAIITHAHASNAHIGNKIYLTHEKSLTFLRYKLGTYADVQTLKYGKQISINGVKISLHPAGHIPGSSQVRFEYKGEVWVVSGDYKLEEDFISKPFESLPCHVFVSEANYGLPFFKWLPQQTVFTEINNWWRKNANAGIKSILVTCSLGKAQRILKNLDTTIAPIYIDEPIDSINAIYKSLDIDLPQCHSLQNHDSGDISNDGLVMVSPNQLGSAYGLEKYKPFSIAMASGRMKIDSIRRKSSLDRGFVLSDHADWIGLNAAIRSSLAERVIINQGQSVFFSKWLNKRGILARSITNALEDRWLLNAPAAYMYG